ncbi:MAG: type III polyketide synthase [Candidatus Promineifilaceae bacterium]|nr:type III polyketide synthase [Candidatus Promineifilaceae bacterium]
MDELRVERGGWQQRERRQQPAPAAIRGLGTAVPQQQLTQTEIYDEILAPFLGTNRLARRIFQHTGITCRHVVVERDYYQRPRSTEARNRRYLQEALPLAERAIARCLEDAGLQIDAVDDFIVVSCTGIDTPGLDLQLAHRLEMRPDLRRATILGMGCYGAMPGLLRAAEAARAGRMALLLALEICSLHFQPDDDSIENTVTSALFADGAAAVLVSPTNAGAADQASPQENGSNGHAAPLTSGPYLVDFETFSDFQSLDQMSFRLTDTGFRMGLGAAVPDILADNVGPFVDRLLARNGLERDDVDIWGVHPGSGKILDFIEGRLELEEGALDHGRAVLCQYGNMSSPTVLFVLDEIHRHATPRPGDRAVLMAFGPGLTLEGALVQW